MNLVFPEGEPLKSSCAQTQAYIWFLTQFLDKKEKKKTSLPERIEL